MDASRHSRLRPVPKHRNCRNGGHATCAVTPGNRGGRFCGKWFAAASVVAGLVFVCAGCSLFLMAGKMLYGDPVQVCAFTSVTGVNLVAEKKSVAVLCTVPAAVESQYPSVGRDILEKVTQRLKREEVKVISVDTVLDWLDDNAGMWSDPDELAEAFDADYIIEIELVAFTHKAENSPQLYQGKTNGYVRAYQVANRDGRRTAEEVFADEDFRSTYPEHHPQPASKTSGEHFLRQYVQRISTQLAQMFYNHHASEVVY